MSNYEELEQYADNDSQRAKLEALKEHGSYRKAAEALGLTKNAIAQTVNSLRKRAAASGIDHLYVKGVTHGTHPNGGETVWVKAAVDEKARLDALREAILQSFEDWRPPQIPAPAEPDVADTSLCSVYPWGDPHFGMLSWEPETGENYDLTIARDLHLTAMRDLVAVSPPSELGLLLNLGDFFHREDDTNRTKRSGHDLDCDGRQMKAFRMGLDCLIDCIHLMLTKHKRVVVRNVPGNHDDLSSMMLTVALEKATEADERVTIESAPSTHWAYQWGDVMMFASHGHSIKPQNIGQVLMSDYRKMVGDTEICYSYGGHWHHSAKQEFGGYTHETFQTLAAKDAYAASHHYRSQRSMSCLVIHKQRGEVQRFTHTVQ